MKKERERKNRNNKNGEGSVRKISEHKWECTIQTKYPNPETLNPMRFKRRGGSAEEATANAKAARDAWVQQYINNTTYRQEKTRTFGNYVFDYINVYRQREDPIKESTRLQYNRDFKYIKKYEIANMQLQNLSKLAFQNYYDRLAANYAEKTFHGAVVLCGATCDWLVERKLLKENYAKQAKVIVEILDEFTHQSESHHKEILSFEDMNKIFQAYDDRLDSEYVYVTLFMLETGIRPNEFQSLTNDCIDFEHRLITIEKTLSTRIRSDYVIQENDTTIPTEKYVAYPKQNRQSKDSRQIPMSDFCIEVTQKMQQKVKEKCKNNPKNLLYPVFRTGNNRSLSTMEVGFKLLCEKLDIDRDVHPVRENASNTTNIGINLKNLRKTRETLMQQYATTSPITNMIKEYYAQIQGHSLKTSNTYYNKPTKEILSTLPQPPSPKAIVDTITNQSDWGLTEEEEKAILKKLLEKYKDDIQ